MVDLAPFVVAGLALGSVYALSGVGMVVLYRATGVLNLAYGALGAVSALVAWQLLESGYTNATAYTAGVALATALSGLYGWLVSPLVADREPLVKAAASLGFALILLGTCFWIWSDDPRTLGLPTDTWGTDLFSTRVNATQVLALVAAVGLTASTTLCLRATRLGVAMRALANDREISAVLGVRTRRVEAVAWVGSGLVAGLTGLVLADLTRLEAGSLTFMVIASLAAGVVGRFRSLAGTLAGGLAIGLLQSVARAYTDVAQYNGVAPFVIAIAVILWMQRRAARARQGSTVDIRAAGVAVAGRDRGPLRALPPGDWGSVLRTLLTGGALVAVLAFAIPAAVDSYWVRVCTTACIYAVVAAATGLLYGRLGLVSLGQVALLGVGGWVALRLSFATDWPFLVVALMAGAVTCLVGVVYGLPALRLGGLDLALVTLMAGGAFEVVFSATGFPDGGSGLLGRVGGTGIQQNVPRPGYVDSDTAFFRFTLAAAAVLFAVILLHQRRRPGRAWGAIRESEAGALASGVAVTLYKLWAFALAAFVTGVAGAFLAVGVGRLDPISFRGSESVLLFAVVLIGGAYGLLGAALAGALSQVVPALLDSAGINGNLILVVFGAGLIHALVTAPRGVAGQIESLALARST